MGEISSYLRGVLRNAADSVRLSFSFIRLRRLNLRYALSGFFGKWFEQTEMTQYERAQRGRILATILKVIFVSGSALFLVNIFIHAWNIAIAVLMVPLFCIPSFWLNSRGRHSTSASLILAVLLCIADYNLYATGGLQDSGMLVYPLIIIVGSLFLGKRAVPMLTFVSVGSLGVLAYLEIKGDFLPAPVSTDAGFCLSACVLLLASGALVWAILNNTERNISHIRRAEEELRKTYHLTLQGLARALEYRDMETEGHSRRVVDLSVRLAREMNFGEDEIEHIQRGALIHDIGKMAIPDHILSKQGPLTYDEKKIMEKHTVYAKEILSPISFLNPASIISYCHHERWDGWGYPQGLRGDEIPLPARLFAIVDQWDALHSERPYRKAWPEERIISYLKDNSGKCFDPRVVDAFMRVVGQG